MEKKTAEEILSEKTGLTINDEYAYRIQTKTEYVLKAMVAYASQESEPLKDKIKELEDMDKLKLDMQHEIDRLNSERRWDALLGNATMEECNNTILQLQTDLTRMRDGLALIFNEIEHIMDDELTTAESKIKEVTESLLSTKQETNQDLRSAGIDKIYSGLSDIQRSNPMPYDDSNKTLAELLKIRNSLVIIKSINKIK